MASQEAKFSSPAALRNRDPIFEILQDVLPATGTVLEIASGSGEHITHYAACMPNLLWQPSDPSSEARASIAARLEEQALPNLLPPLDLDVMLDPWPIEKADMIMAINMVHISPWNATKGLLRGAARLLPEAGALLLYGPYRQEGRPFVQSNADFDASLKARNPDWGIRPLEEVVTEAEQAGLRLDAVHDMPANNLCVILKKTG